MVVRFVREQRAARFGEMLAEMWMRTVVDQIDLVRVKAVAVDAQPRNDRTLVLEAHDIDIEGRQQVKLPPSLENCAPISWTSPHVADCDDDNFVLFLADDVDDAVRKSPQLAPPSNFAKQWRPMGQLRDEVTGCKQLHEKSLSKSR